MHYLKKLRTIKKLMILSLVLIVTIEIVMVFGTGNKDIKWSFDEYAQQVVESCKDSNYRPSCYDKSIPKLMDSSTNLSMEDVFKVTQIVQQKDSAYQYCHVLGHELSAREVRKDPSKWKEVVTRCPSGVCSNGCIHGGFQERFRTDHFDTDEQIDAIIPDLNIICEKRGKWEPTGLEQASCYHALGHLTMYITNADVKKAISLCNITAVKKDGRDYSQLCYDGVFMQIFQPLEPEDFALIEGKQPTLDTLEVFCNLYKGAQKGSCLSESWPLFKNLFDSSENIISFCAMQEEKEQADRCYHAMNYVMTPMLHFDLSKIRDICEGYPTTRQAGCFSDVASRLIEVDYRNINKAIEACKISSESDKENKCFINLLFYSQYNFHPNSQEFYQMCNAMPEPWKAKCLNKEQILIEG